MVTELKGPSTVLLRIGTSVRTVHINRVRPPLLTEVKDQTESTNWTPPPLFNHEEDPMRLTAKEPLEVQGDYLSFEAASVPPSEGEDSLEDPPEPSLVPPVPTATRTTRSGRQVKLVQHYGWT